jgi:hypothetical protein
MFIRYNDRFSQNTFNIIRTNTISIDDIKTKCVVVLYRNFTFSTRLSGRRRGRDRMVVGFYNYLCNQCLSPLTLRVRIRTNEVYAIEHYVIKFVNDLRQVGGFLLVLRFPPPIKLTATI